MRADTEKLTLNSDLFNGIAGYGARFQSHRARRKKSPYEDKSILAPSGARLRAISENSSYRVPAAAGTLPRAVSSRPRFLFYTACDGAASCRSSTQPRAPNTCLQRGGLNRAVHAALRFHLARAEVFWRVISRKPIRVADAVKPRQAVFDLARASVRSPRRWGAARASVSARGDKGVPAARDAAHTDPARALRGEGEGATRQRAGEARLCREKTAPDLAY
ncbi:hypothetical protein FB451DRAFT_1162211 [Mycena latifolia]|nr:hypothetical protein FB451DRAFT_1162211 [Mycena latifolia]